MSPKPEDAKGKQKGTGKNFVFVLSEDLIERE